MRACHSKTFKNYIIFHSCTHVHNDHNSMLKTVDGSELSELIHANLNLRYQDKVFGVVIRSMYICNGSHLYLYIIVCYRHKIEIEEIVECALKELNLELQLNSVEEEWAEQVLM